MGRHVEGYWVRKNNWFLRWLVTDDEIQLFDLRNDLHNDHDVSKEFSKEFSALKALADTYKAAKGEDPRISFYRRMNAKEE